MSFQFFVLNIILFLTQKPQPKFEAQTIDNNVSIGYGMAIGDVDGDKKPDILLADKKQFVWYRNGDWKRFVMIENLTESDNVCIAARDINGDGKVEVAVGAQWNPGETGSSEKSGSVHFLIGPDDPTQLWKAVQLYHEPTIHRMKWVQSPGGKFHLVVLPLHGVGNKGGEGNGVNILFYSYPELINTSQPAYTIQTNMHMTHNFEVVESKDTRKASFYVAGKEGIRVIHSGNDNLFNKVPEEIKNMNNGAGEVRIGKLTATDFFIATIEPMHGNQLVVYGKNKERLLLDSNIKEGHALACADFLGAGNDQVVAGWRLSNKDGKVGVKIYVRKDVAGNEWEAYWVDENEMACEDIQVMDLNGDGKKDIVASGRATHNLKIYWNKTGK
jgi:hypothetical protein